VAFAVTYWVFGEIHLMTLVFGASLIGVCVDFSFYFMAMQSQHRQIDGFAVLKPLLPSLFVG
jgi:predicted exporter